MSLIKKLAGETAIYGIPTILSKVLNFWIIASYLTSLLDTVEYGYMQLMFVFAAYAMVVYTYRMETTLFRFGSKTEDAERSFSTAASTILITTGAISLLIILFAKPLAGLILEREDLHRYFYYFAGILAFDACAVVPFAKLRLENKAALFAKLKALNIVLNLVLLLFCFEVLPKLGYDYDLAHKLDIVFLSNLMTSLVVLIFIIPTYKITGKWEFDKDLLKKMIAYTWPLAVIAMAGVLNQYVQFNFLKWMEPTGTELTSDEVVGRYGAAAKLAVFMTLFTTAFNYAAEPFFFKQAAGPDDKSVYGKVAFAYTLVALFVFLGVTYYIDVLQLILRKEAFREAVDAVPILLLAFLFLGLYYNVAIWYKLSDKTRFGMLISIVGVVITVIMNFALIPSMSYFGSAYATLACYVVMVGLCYYLGQRHYPLEYPVMKILKYVVLAVIFWQLAVAIRPSMSENLAMILLANTGLLAGFAGLVYVLDGKYIRSILK